MLRFLYFSLRYGSYLRSEHGIRELAESCMGQLIYKVTEKAAFFRERNQSLIVEKANLLRRAEELGGQTTLEPGAFHSVRGRLWGGMLLITAVFLAAIFLSYAAAATFVEAGTGFSALWITALVLAFVLIGGGLFACEHLLDALFARGTLQAAQPEQDPGKRALPWMLLLIGIELAIAGLSTIPADLLAARTASTLLYHGTVMASIVLPLIAGFAGWDVMRQVDAFRNTQALNQIEIRLSQIEAILHQNEWEEQNFYDIAHLAAWNHLSAFKAYKETYNARRGISEDLSFHFSENYQAFQAEANRRLGSSMKEAAVLSVEQLGSTIRKQVGPRTWPALPKGDGYRDVKVPDVQLSR